MWTYSQKTGELSHDGKLAGSGYSGFGAGLNNGDLEALVNEGPIPRGSWQIVRWDDHHADKGPVVAVLEPVGHDAHGRSGFLVHGDNAEANHTASHGCIIAARSIRESWRASGDMELGVTE